MRLAHLAVALTTALVFVGAGCAPAATTPSAPIQPTAVETTPAAVAPEGQILAVSPDGNFVLRGTGDCSEGTLSFAPGEEITDEMGAYTMYNLSFLANPASPMGEDTGAVFVQKNADRLAEWSPQSLYTKAFEADGVTVYSIFANDSVTDKCHLTVTQK